MSEQDLRVKSESPPPASKAESSSTSPPVVALPPLQPSKQACLACRNVKKKCYTASQAAACERCAQLDIPCVYTQARRRGRKPGNGVAAAKRTTSQSRPPVNASPSTSSRPLPSASAPSAAPPPPSFTIPSFANLNQPDSEQVRLTIAQSFAAYKMRAVARVRPQDIMQVGIVSENQGKELFSFFFTYLSTLCSIFDPSLHTFEYIRSRSPLLLSAILSVALKFLPSPLFPSAQTHVRQLLGDAFGQGENSIEMIQTCALMTFWAEAGDLSDARRMSYVIRGAYELDLDRVRTEPLPDDELKAREILNKERTWIHLCVADQWHSFHTTTPRTILSPRQDILAWIVSHNPKYACPSEAGLAPLSELVPLIDLQRVLLTSEDPVTEQMISIVENEILTWEARWIAPEPIIPLQPNTAALCRFHAKISRFQLYELQLLYTRTTSTLTSKTRDAYIVCIKTALEALASLKVELPTIVYLWDWNWIGVAFLTSWLALIVDKMPADYRRDTLSVLKDTQELMQHQVRGRENSFVAYASRLTLSMLAKVNASSTSTSIASAASSSSAVYVPAPTGTQARPPAVPSLTRPNPPVFDPLPPVAAAPAPTTQQQQQRVPVFVPPATPPADQGAMDVTLALAPLQLDEEFNASGTSTAAPSLESSPFDFEFFVPPPAFDFNMHDVSMLGYHQQDGEQQQAW